MLWATTASGAKRPAVTMVDHGLRPAVFPCYLGRGPGLGWQDLYNQDDTGRYWLRREFEFRGTRLGWRIGQTFAGSAARPVGRLGLRFAQSGHRVTRTQPRWLATWGRHDAKFPGLLDVLMDGKSLVGVPVDIAGTHTGPVGHVRFRWDHPSGVVEAVFTMLPDDDRLFVEVRATPRRTPKRMTVSLCCWPFGQFRVRTATGLSPVLTYGKPRDLPKGDRTVLLTDPAFDRGGGLGEGTCGLTYFPSECVSATVTRTFPLFVNLDLPIPRTGSPAYLHVVLWELLHRRGDEAWRYLTDREPDTLARFDRLAGVAAPRFAERRHRTLDQVRRQLAVLDRQIKRTSPPTQQARLRRGYWALSRTALAWRWARFYRDEAAYHLAAEDGLAASHALRTATQHLVKIGR